MTHFLKQEKDKLVMPRHCKERKQNRTRHMVIQFTRRHHRDDLWKLMKESRVCQEAGLKFVEDLKKEERLAREAL